MKLIYCEYCGESFVKDTMQYDSMCDDCARERGYEMPDSEE